MITIVLYYHLPFTPKGPGFDSQVELLELTRTESSCEKSISQRSAEGRTVSSEYSGFLILTGKKDCVG